jgi:N-methylhydantoinase B/oxoprolinase/acetone carboxylase alpha subunit
MPQTARLPRPGGGGKKKKKEKEKKKVNTDRKHGIIKARNLHLKYVTKIKEE